MSIQICFLSDVFYGRSISNSLANILRTEWTCFGDAKFSISFRTIGYDVYLFRVSLARRFGASWCHVAINLNSLKKMMALVWNVIHVCCCRRLLQLLASRLRNIDLFRILAHAPRVSAIFWYLHRCFAVSFALFDVAPRLCFVKHRELHINVLNLFCLNPFMSILFWWEIWSNLYHQTTLENTQSVYVVCNTSSQGVGGWVLNFLGESEIPTLSLPTRFPLGLSDLLF